MARRHHPAAVDTLDEIESAADRLGEWLQTHIRAVIAVVVGVLALSGLVAGLISARKRSEAEASTALAKVRADYLSAMGASPGALEVPELANPEAAAQIRSEYEGRFEEVEASHPGTVAGTLAALESASLAQESGRTSDAIAHVQRALEDAPGNPALRGLLLQHLGQWLEDEKRFEEAARYYEEAAGLEDYPLHAWALADAARCAADAGDPKRALALYDRLEVEAPELRLPDYQQAQLLRLRVRLPEP